MARLFDRSRLDAYRRWVPLFRTQNAVEAHLVRGLLEGEGISCWVRSKGIALLPVTVNGLGEVVVCVDAADQEAGQRILDDVRGSPPPP